jgi:DNA invertase Pin-like site-specific DNA recombinase
LAATFEKLERWFCDTKASPTVGRIGKAMLTIMAAFTQLERDTMIERTAQVSRQRQPTGARADVPARSTTLMLLRRAA